MYLDCYVIPMLTFIPQISGLKFGAKYSYRVLAENAAGQSDPSNIVGPVLADDPHCKWFPGHCTLHNLWYIWIFTNCLTHDVLLLTQLHLLWTWAHLRMVWKLLSLILLQFVSLSLGTRCPQQSGPLVKMSLQLVTVCPWLQSQPSQSSL